MTVPDAAAIARLEVQVQHLIASAARREAAMERMAEQIDAMQAKLDQSAGGFAVLRWLGFGSLGSAIAAMAAVGTWFAWMKGQ